MVSIRCFVATLSLYSQVFDREISVVRRTSLSMIEQWWQLSALPRRTLPNKVKQFVLIKSFLWCLYGAEVKCAI